MGDNVIGVKLSEEILFAAPRSVRMAIRGSSIRYLLACISETAQGLDAEEEEIQEFIGRGITALMNLGVPEEEIDWAMRHGPPVEDEK